MLTDARLMADPAPIAEAALRAAAAKFAPRTMQQPSSLLRGIAAQLNPAFASAQSLTEPPAAATAATAAVAVPPSAGGTLEAQHSHHSTSYSDPARLRLSLPPLRPLLSKQGHAQHEALTGACCRGRYGPSRWHDGGADACHASDHCCVGSASILGRSGGDAGAVISIRSKGRCSKSCTAAKCFTAFVVWKIRHEVG